MQKKKSKKTFKILQMVVLPRKSDTEELSKFIENLKKCTNLYIEYTPKDKILNIKDDKHEYIIYAENPVDIMNYLTGFKGGILDFCNSSMSEIPLKGEK